MLYVYSLATFFVKAAIFGRISALCISMLLCISERHITLYTSSGFTNKYYIYICVCVCVPVFCSTHTSLTIVYWKCWNKNRNQLIVKADTLREKKTRKQKGKRIYFMRVRTHSLPLTDLLYSQSESMIFNDDWCLNVIYLSGDFTTAFLNLLGASHPLSSFKSIWFFQVNQLNQLKIICWRELYEKIQLPKG